MNAATDTLPEAPRTKAVPHKTQRFRWLLQREFWEHKGGFFWAPLVAGGIALLFSLLGAVAVSLLKSRHGNDIDLGNASPDEVAKALGATGDVALLGGVSIAMTVLGFVVFFYALGCLYDDRRDRSILFWKSLPLSDTSTVLAKVTWALLLAPLLATVIGLIVGLSLLVVTAFTTTVNGVPEGVGILTHSHPVRILFNIIAMLPLYALWAMPTVGWLMLCSAAARTKPFLWAVIIPVLGCALVSFTSLTIGLEFDLGSLWYSTAYRGLLSVFPGTWFPALNNVSAIQVHGPEDIANIVGVWQNWRLIGVIDLWIGVAAGAAMIFAAIRLRRWRDEG